MSKTVRRPIPATALYLSESEEEWFFGVIPSHFRHRSTHEQRTTPPIIVVQIFSTLTSYFKACCVYGYIHMEFCSFLLDR